MTGVDLSEEAITLARRLSRELHIDAEFVCSDILAPGGILPHRQFDVVFTSYGVLCWLPDLTAWARLIVDHLAPGGTFYMVEFHPLAMMLDERGSALRYPYFHEDKPERFEERGSYGAPESNFTHASYLWSHGLGDVVNALTNAGLRLEFLHEFPFSSYGCFPFLEEEAPDRFILKRKAKGGAEGSHSPAVPLMFSIRALK